RQPVPQARTRHERATACRCCTSGQFWLEWAVTTAHSTHDRPLAAGSHRGRSMKPLVIAHLYPREMNIYGDTGNVLVLRRRLEWRELPCRVVAVNDGDPLPTDADLVLVGGGQDAAQGE